MGIDTFKRFQHGSVTDQEGRGRHGFLKEKKELYWKHIEADRVQEKVQLWRPYHIMLRTLFCW
jgi:hypothetical protein